MESINLVTIAGKIKSSAHSADSTKIIVATNQMYEADGEKQFDEELHSVKIKKVASIAKYLNPGKHVVIIGRLKYAKPDNAPYILATTVHFVGGGDA